MKPLYLLIGVVVLFAFSKRSATPPPTNGPYPPALAIGPSPAPMTMPDGLTTNDLTSAMLDSSFEGLV